MLQTHPELHVYHSRSFAVCCQTIDSRMLIKAPGDYQVYVTTGLDNSTPYMANRSVPSDHELVSLAREFTLERDFFNLGVNLNFLITVLNKFLKECKDNVYRATLVNLQQWRDNQRPGTDVRSKLYTVLKQLGYHKAADMLVTDDDDFDKRSLLRKVEVYSESSASITKNMDIQSDLTDEESMLSSANSQSDYSMSFEKDSKFDGSGSEKHSEPSSTGLTDDLDQLNVDRTPDPGRVAEWINEAEPVRQLMIGAPGADRLPGRTRKPIGRFDWNGGLNWNFSQIAEYQQHRNVQIFNQQRPKPLDECNHAVTIESIVML